MRCKWLPRMWGPRKHGDCVNNTRRKGIDEQTSYFLHKHGLWLADGHDASQSDARIEIMGIEFISNPDPSSLNQLTHLSLGYI